MTDDEKCMCVELRLDGMPKIALDYYAKCGLLKGVYGLWFRDSRWKEAIIAMVNAGEFERDNQMKKQPTPEEDREFFLWCMDMRLKGAHPDWLLVWRGSFESGRYVETCRQWLDRGTKIGFPWDAHMRAPEDKQQKLLEDGREWWDKVHRGEIHFD